MDKKLIEKCIKIYKSGGSRMDVARFIQEQTGLKETASKQRARTIWDNHFDEDYEPKYKQDTDSSEAAGLLDVNSAKFENKSYNKSEAYSKSNNIRTLDGLLKACDVDLNVWKVDRHVINKWEVAAKDGDGALQNSPLYQVKAWLSRRKENELEDVLKFFRDELNKNERKKIPNLERSSCDNVYEISIPDLHLSKYCWEPETGENYDINIAVRLFKKSFYDLMSRVDLSKIREVVIPIGNDFFNSEGLQGQTTAGTRQDDDSRWQKSFTEGCKLITDCIDSYVGRVNFRIIIVPGNHDEERCYYLGEYLNAWYRANKSVIVDNAPTKQKYYVFGENVIYYAHGKDEKPQDIPLTMARECKDFSRCKYPQARLGHLHTEITKEYKGVKVKFLPSLCAADAWHKSKLFTNNVRSACSSLYNKDKGEIATYWHNL